MADIIRISKKIDDYEKYVLDTCCEYCNSMFSDQSYISELVSLPILVKAKHL